MYCLEATIFAIFTCLDNPWFLVNEPLLESTKSLALEVLPQIWSRSFFQEKRFIWSKHRFRYHTRFFCNKWKISREEPLESRQDSTRHLEHRAIKQRLHRFKPKFLTWTRKIKIAAMSLEKFEDLLGSRTKKLKSYRIQNLTFRELKVNTERTKRWFQSPFTSNSKEDQKTGSFGSRRLRYEKEKIVPRYADKLFKLKKQRQSKLSWSGIDEVMLSSFY